LSPPPLLLLPSPLRRGFFVGDAPFDFNAFAFVFVFGFVGFVVFVCFPLPRRRRAAAACGRCLACTTAVYGRGTATRNNCNNNGQRAARLRRFSAAARAGAPPPPPPLPPSTLPRRRFARLCPPFSAGANVLFKVRNSPPGRGGVRISGENAEASMQIGDASIGGENGRVS
jgi:hypothetical protein